MATKFQREKTKRDPKLEEEFINIQKDWAPTKEKIGTSKLRRIIQALGDANFEKMKEFKEILVPPSPAVLEPEVERTIDELLQIEFDARPKINILKRFKETLILQKQEIALGATGIAVLGFTTASWALMVPVAYVLYQDWKTKSWKPLALFSRATISGLATSTLTFQVLGKLALVIPGGIGVLPTIAITATITVIGGEIVNGVINKIFCIKEQEPNAYAALLAASEAQWAAKYLSWDPKTNTYNYSHWKRFREMTRGPQALAAWYGLYWACQKMDFIGGNWIYTGFWALYGHAYFIEPYYRIVMTRIWYPVFRILGRLVEKIPLIGHLPPLIRRRVSQRYIQLSLKIVSQMFLIYVGGHTLQWIAPENAFPEIANVYARIRYGRVKEKVVEFGQEFVEQNLKADLTWEAILQQAPPKYQDIGRTFPSAEEGVKAILLEIKKKPLKPTGAPSFFPPKERIITTQKPPAPSIQRGIDFESLQSISARIAQSLTAEQLFQTFWKSSFMEDWKRAFTNSFKFGTGDEEGIGTGWLEQITNYIGGGKGDLDLPKAKTFEESCPYDQSKLRRRSNPLQILDEQGNDVTKSCTSATPMSLISDVWKMYAGVLPGFTVNFATQLATVAFTWWGTLAAQVAGGMMKGIVNHAICAKAMIEFSNVERTPEDRLIWAMIGGTNGCSYFEGRNRWGTLQTVWQSAGPAMKLLSDPFQLERKLANPYEIVQGLGVRGILGDPAFAEDPLKKLILEHENEVTLERFLEITSKETPLVKNAFNVGIDDVFGGIKGWVSGWQTVIKTGKRIATAEFSNYNQAIEKKLKKKEEYSEGIKLIEEGSWVSAKDVLVLSNRQVQDYVDSGIWGRLMGPAPPTDPGNWILFQTHLRTKTTQTP